MKTLLNLLSLLLICSNCLFAQSLILKKGTRTKEIQSDRFIEIYINKLLPEEKEKCNYDYYHGRLKQINSDSIQLDLAMKQSCIQSHLGGEKNAIFYSDHSDFRTLTWVAKKDISSIEPSFSKEKLTKRKKMSNVAGIIFFAGLGSAASAFLVKNKNDRKQIWIASGVAVGLGITIGTSNTNSDFKTKGEKNIWTIQ